MKKKYHRHDFLDYFPNTGDYRNLEPKPKDTTISGPPEPVILKECFDLPLSSCHLGVFLGAGGKNIKPLCTQYKVQMHLGEEGGSESQGGGRRGRSRGKQFIHTTGDTINVTVCSKPEDKADVKGFKEELTKKAKAVTKSREKHQENVNFILCTECIVNLRVSLLPLSLPQYTQVAAFSQILLERRKKRAQIQEMKRDKRMMKGSYGVFGNPKEELAEQFEKKQLAKSKYVSKNYY
jgi:hypothetical protein